MGQETHHGEAGERSEQTHIEMPASSSWPMMFAFEITLLLAGMVTQYAVSVVGFIPGLSGAVGWWRNVIPVEGHEQVSLMRHFVPRPFWWKLGQ